MQSEFDHAKTSPLFHSPHLEPDPVKRERALEALDNIYGWIVFTTTDLLNKINLSLFDVNRAGPTDYETAAQAYNDAVKAFKKFVNSLNDETPGKGFKDDTFGFGPTINAANIDPIRDVDGFYTSARIIVQWQGGTHSDSTVTHAP